MIIGDITFFFIKKFKYTSLRTYVYRKWNEAALRVEKVRWFLSILGRNGFFCRLAFPLSIQMNFNGNYPWGVSGDGLDPGKIKMICSSGSSVPAGGHGERATRTVLLISVHTLPARSRDFPPSRLSRSNELDNRLSRLGSDLRPSVFFRRKTSSSLYHLSLRTLPMSSA